MMIPSGYSTPTSLTLDKMEEIAGKARADVIADNNKNSPLMAKINKIWHAIEYWFSGSDTLYRARNTLYKLCELEHNYQYNHSDPISHENFNALIDSIHTLKTLISPGCKNDFYLSLGQDENIIVNVGSNNKITLPNVSSNTSQKEIDFLHKIISDDRKENLHRLFPLSLSAGRTLLSSSHIDKLQKIYTNGKEHEKKIIQEDVDEINKDSGNSTKITYEQQCREKVIAQMALDNVRDGNLEQHIYINSTYHEPLNNYKAVLGNKDAIIADKSFIQDSRIFKSITKIPEITDMQINALCGHLCQTSMNLMVGTLFASTEFYCKEINNGEKLSFLLNQSRRANNETDPEITLINIEKTSTDDILVTNSFCITPKYNVTESPQGSSIETGYYFHPFNIALSYTTRIDINGNEKIESYSISFIPATEDFLTNTQQLKLILPKYNEENEKKFILETIRKNLDSAAILTSR